MLLAGLQGALPTDGGQAPSLVNAALEAGEPVPEVDSRAGRRTVWYKWQLPSTVPAGVCTVTVTRLNQQSGFYGVRVLVYRDTKGTLGGLSLVASAFFYATP